MKADAYTQDGLLRRARWGLAYDGLDPVMRRCAAKMIMWGRLYLCPDGLLRPPYDHCRSDVGYT